MKYKIFLEYNGTNYAGWQQQKNAKTVQGALIDAIKTIFSNSKGESRFIELQGGAELTGCSRERTGGTSRMRNDARTENI